MHITSLPISYRPGRSFRVLFTGFVASCLSQITGSKLILALNATSLRDKEPVTTELLEKTYHDDMAELETKQPDRTFNDKEPQFLQFVTTEIQSSLRLGHSIIKTLEILHCPCGRVESPKEVIELSVTENRSGFVQKNGGELHCIFCKGKLEQTMQNVFLHHNIPPTPIKALPASLSGRITSLIESSSAHPIVFSRHARPENGFMVEGKVIDPDYCWMHMFGYLHKVTKETNFCLVVGSDTIPQAVKLLQFTKLYYPELKITLVAHPLLQFTGNCAVNKKTTVTDFIRLCSNPTCAKTILTSSLQWTRHYSALPFGEIDIAQKSHSHVPPNYPGTETNLTLEEALNIIHHDAVNKLLKALRQKRALNEKEMALLKVLRT